MNPNTQSALIAFTGNRRIAAGSPRSVAAEVKAYVDQHHDAQVLVFDAVTSRPVELDLRGSAAEVLQRLPAEAPLVEAAPEASRARQPGRPRLGVVAREVTLLPRHWEWLASQPGGASVALRKLVEEATRSNREVDRRREAVESTFRFMNAMAGNERGFEEATRALFAGDRAKFAELLADWPADLREHCIALGEAAFATRQG